MATDTMGSKLEQAKDRITGQTHSTMGQAQHTTGGLQGQAQETAGRLAGQVHDTAGRVSGTGHEVRSPRVSWLQ